MPSVAAMITWVRTLGSRCRRRTRRSRAPSARAASTNSERLSTSTWLRTSRAIPAQPDDADHDEDHRQRRLDRGGDRDEQQQRGKGERDVGQPHHQGVDPTAVVAGHQPEQDAEGHRDRLGDEADRERQPRAVEHPAQDVAPLGVGAQEEPAAGLQQVGVPQVAREGVERGQPGREQRRSHDQGDEDQAQLKEPVAAQPLPQHPWRHAAPVTWVTLPDGNRAHPCTVGLSPRAAHDSCTFVRGEGYARHLNQGKRVIPGPTLHPGPQRRRPQRARPHRRAPRPGGAGAGAEPGGGVQHRIADRRRLGRRGDRRSRWRRGPGWSAGGTCSRWPGPTSPSAACWRRRSTAASRSKR